jgi:hypothetical protein
VTVLQDTLARCEHILPPADRLTETVRDSLINITGG